MRSLLIVVFCLGASAQPSVFIDFEGGSNGSGFTTGTLNASTHNGSSGAWLAVPSGNSTISYASAGQLANFLNSVTVGGTPYTGTGSLGFQYATGTAGVNILWGPNAPPDICSWGHWIKWTIPDNDTSANAYSTTTILCAFMICTTGDYMDAVLHPSGTSMSICLEIKSNGQVCGVTVHANTLYWLTGLYASGATHKLNVYDSAGALVGALTGASVATGSNPCQYLEIGISGAETQTGGFNIWVDNFLISLTGTFPLGPTFVSGSSSTGASKISGAGLIH